MGALAMKNLRDMAARIGKVLICSAVYDSKVHLAYHTSMVTTLVMFERMGVKWDQWHWEGDFHVERAVNGMLSRFLNSDFDQVLFIDTDEAWKAHDVARILSHTEEVVGGSYRMKNAFNEYVGAIKREDGQPIGKMLPDGTALLAAERVAGGFLKTRRSALEKLVPTCDWYYWTDRQTGITEKHYAFFWNEVRNNEFFGMDYVYCERLKKAGVELWIDPVPKIAHFGTKRWEGDFDKYLRDAGKTEEAFSIVKEMANGDRNIQGN